MPFVGRVLLDPLKEPGWFDRGLWIVAEDIVYKSRRHPDVVIAIPKGTRTDLSSVPRWLPLTWMLTGGTNIKGSVVHDFLYHHPVYLGQERKMLPRKICDDIFDEVGETASVPKWRRFIMWLGVRVGGWASYGEE